MKKINMIRLIADEGKELYNGDVSAMAVDCFADKADEWAEREINISTEKSSKE